MLKRDRGLAIMQTTGAECRSRQAKLYTDPVASRSSIRGVGRPLRGPGAIVGSLGKFLASQPVTAGEIAREPPGFGGRAWTSARHPIAGVGSRGLRVVAAR
jgi:hypothetical protein